jgi:hypothetical protein
MIERSDDSYRASVQPPLAAKLRQLLARQYPAKDDTSVRCRAVQLGDVLRQIDSDGGVLIH